MLKNAWARFCVEWPAWLTALFVFALPFRRNSEISIGFMFLLFPILMQQRAYRQLIKPVLRFIIPIFLCFWIPMVISNFDSYDSEKSFGHVLLAMRFPIAALSIALLLSKNELRQRCLQLVAFILLFWAIDGYVQLAQLLFIRMLVGGETSDQVIKLV